MFIVDKLYCTCRKREDELVIGEKPRLHLVARSEMFSMHRCAEPSARVYLNWPQTYSSSSALFAYRQPSPTVEQVREAGDGVQETGIQILSLSELHNERDILYGLQHLPWEAEALTPTRQGKRGNCHDGQFSFQ